MARFPVLAAGEPRLRAVSQTAYQRWWLLRFENAREELVTSRGLPEVNRAKRRGRSGRVLLFVRPKRLLRSFVFGSAALLGAWYLASLMYFWEPWKALTLEWMKALAKYAT